MSWSINGYLLRSITPYILAALVLAFYTWRLTRAMTQARREEAARKPEPPAGDQSGASAVEFLLLFPLLLMLLLIILQVALITQARFVVNYAAFCAARSAIVVIPAKAAGEDRNQLNQDAGSPKMTMIHRAAALPCVAISPAWSADILRSTLTPPNPGLVVPMEQVALAFPAAREGTNISQQLAARAHYAFNQDNTRVEIFSEGGDQGGSFDMHALVRARVTHRYYLTVPFANRLFGKSYYGITFMNGLGLLNFSGFYATIAEEYTLVNEGEPPFHPNQDPGQNEIQVGG